MSSDRPVQDHIEELVAEEHRLLEAHGSAGLDPREHARLEHIRLELDQLWDLLRQRRARRAAGLDPEGASERDSDTIERYEG
jgi:hypothetical protein